MKINPIANPANPRIATAKAEVVSSARERAIAKLMQSPQTPATNAAPASTPEPTPVPNPTSISPEEFGQFMPKKTAASEELSTEASDGQNITSEVTSTSEALTSEEPISPQFAALARKEKALRAKALAQEKALKDREAALLAREEALKPKPEVFDPNKYISREEIAKDPFSVLAKLGISYDQLTELALNAPKPEDIARSNEIAALKAEIEALKGNTEKVRQTFEEQQKQAYQQAKNQLKSEVNHLVNKDPSFETIKETGSVDDVVELIEKTFKEEGVLMSVEEAAQAVEDYLIEEALKLAKLKKIQAKLQPTPAVSTPAKSQEAQKQQQPQQTGMKTLTNSVSSSRQLSARERAMLAFKGELKS